MRPQSGNVLLYVLIAILLLAGLTVMLMRSGGENGAGGRLTDDRAALRAGELIDYATAARSTVEQMRTLQNVLSTEFSFVKPGDAAYGTGTNTAQVFHPAGGGLNIFTDSPELFATTSSTRGWVSQQGTNVQWTPSTGSDILYTFVDLPEKICQAINDRLYKDKTVPTMTITAAEAFINGGSDDVDLTSTNCAGCNGKVSMCVKDSAGAYAFYNVVLSR